MAYVMGIDLETTGLDETECVITEFSGIIWDTDKNVMLNGVTALIKSDGLEVPEFITKLTGIDSDMIPRGISKEACLGSVKTLTANIKLDYLVAHNAPFEQKFLKGFWGEEFNLPWIDTKVDIPFPFDANALSLIDIAARHGILNPFPHRAMPDVMTMMMVLSQYDFKEVERYALAEEVTLIAKIPFHLKDKAKELGYRWNPTTKEWYKIIKDFQLEEELKKGRVVNAQQVAVQEVLF